MVLIASLGIRVYIGLGKRASGKGQWAKSKVVALAG